MPDFFPWFPMPPCFLLITGQTLTPLTFWEGGGPEDTYIHFHLWVREVLTLEIYSLLPLDPSPTPTTTPGKAWLVYCIPIGGERP